MSVSGSMSMHCANRCRQTRRSSRRSAVAADPWPASLRLCWLKENTRNADIMWKVGNSAARIAETSTENFVIRRRQTSTTPWLTPSVLPTVLGFPCRMYVRGASVSPSNVREARDGQSLALHEQLVDDLVMHEALCRHLGLVHVIVIT